MTKNHLEFDLEIYKEQQNGKVYQLFLTRNLYTHLKDLYRKLDILLRFQWQTERASFGFRLVLGLPQGIAMRCWKTEKKTNGIYKIVEENKIETRNCLLFFDTLSMRKNKTLNKDKNKNIFLPEIKEHAI